MNAEKLEHGTCDLTSIDAGFSADGPCTHLMLGTQYAYLYNQEETHCCISSKPDYGCHLAPIAREFYKVFDFRGDIANYTSESGYYQGPVKHYSTSMPGGGPSTFYFWYVTDPSGKPIEQGEGPCDMYNSDGTRDCGFGPKYIYHQYDPPSFTALALDHTVFSVPDVCRTTKETCLVAPTSLCTGDAPDPGSMHPWAWFLLVLGGIILLIILVWLIHHFCVAVRQAAPDAREPLASGGQGNAVVPT